MLILEITKVFFFKEIYVGFMYTKVPKGNIGCALVCAPYVALAKQAVPKDPTTLLSLTLPEWIEQYGGKKSVHQKH